MKHTQFKNIRGITCPRCDGKGCDHCDESGWFPPPPPPPPPVTLTEEDVAEIVLSLQKEEEEEPAWVYGDWDQYERWMEEHDEGDRPPLPDGPSTCRI